MTNPRISDARALCHKFQARQVLVFALDGARIAGASYGETKAECRDAGLLVDEIVAAIEKGKIGIGQEEIL